MEKREKFEGDETRRGFLKKGLAFLAATTGLTSGCLQDMKEGTFNGGADTQDSIGYADVGVDGGADVQDSGGYADVGVDGGADVQDSGGYADVGVDVEAEAENIGRDISVALDDGKSSVDYVPVGARNLYMYGVNFGLISSGEYLQVDDVVLTISGLISDINKRIKISQWKIEGNTAHMEVTTGTAVPDGYLSKEFWIPVLMDFPRCADNCDNAIVHLSIEKPEDVVLSGSEDFNPVGDFPISRTFNLVDVGMGYVTVRDSVLDEAQVSVDASEFEFSRGEITSTGEAMILREIQLVWGGLYSYIPEFMSFRLEINGQQVDNLSVYDLTGPGIAITFQDGFFIPEGETITFRVFGSADNLEAGKVLKTSVYDVIAHSTTFLLPGTASAYGFDTIPVNESEGTEITFV